MKSSSAPIYVVLYGVLNNVHILGHCFVSVKTYAAHYADKMLRHQAVRIRDTATVAGAVSSYL